MTDIDWIDEVARESGTTAPARAEALLLHVLEGLGSMVPRDKRERAAMELAERAAEALRRPAYDRALEADWLVDRVSERQGVGAAAAREQIEAVLRVLDERLSPDGFRVFAAELPASVAKMIPPPRPDSARRERPSRPAAPAHRIADGRPGSAHPIAELTPPSRAHAHSVARTDDPHGDTKLSEADGLTQQREHESLADADPTGRRRSVR